VEICERLDGLPLAIELAAVQLRVWSVADLHAGLARRAHSLSARYARPAHHRALRDSFDWSFELCSPAEQRLWPRLAVFAGSFSLDAATGVCADEDLPAEQMLDVVAGLVDKSIVLREEVAGSARYRLLETVREYGGHRLSDDALAALRRRHRDWYLDLAERFEAQWFGPDQQRWSAELRADLDNLRGALSWCLEIPGEVRAGLRLAGALDFYWVGCGRLTEGRYWLDRLLPADSAPTATRVVALSTYTSVLLTQNDLPASAASTEECLTLARQLGDPYLIARATGDLGMREVMDWLHRREIRTRDNMARARAILEDSLARYAGLERPDRANMTEVRTALASALMFLGEPEQAIRLCAECDAFCQAHGEQYWRAYVLVISGMIELARQDPVQAAGYLRGALPLQLGVGNVAGLCLALDLLNVATGDTGDLARVARLTGVSQRIRDLGQAEWGAEEHRARVAEVVRSARSGLGERAYEAAYQEGWEMSLEEAVAYALDARTVPPVPAPVQPAPDSQLTRREREVAELISQGMSNREIAGRLVISQRTAESHVENVLRKLGFTARAQIAVWIIEQARDAPPADR
jgi:non-specific serine/threonine protein kinase